MMTTYRTSCQSPGHRWVGWVAATLCSLVLVFYSVTGAAQASDLNLSKLEARLAQAFPQFGGQFAHVLAESLPDTVGKTVLGLESGELIHFCLACAPVSWSLRDSATIPLEVACAGSDDWTTLFLAILTNEDETWRVTWSCDTIGPLADPSISSALVDPLESQDKLILFSGRSGMRSAAAVPVYWNGQRGHVLDRLLGLGTDFTDIDNDGRQEVRTVSGGWGDSLVERIYVFDREAKLLRRAETLRPERKDR